MIHGVGSRPPRVVVARRIRLFREGLTTRFATTAAPLIIRRWHRNHTFFHHQGLEPGSVSSRMPDLLEGTHECFAATTAPATDPGSEPQQGTHDRGKEAGDGQQRPELTHEVNPTACSYGLIGITSGGAMKRISCMDSNTFHPPFPDPAREDHLDG